MATSEPLLCSFCGGDGDRVAVKSAVICAKCVCLCMDRLQHNNDVRNSILAAVNFSVTLRDQPIPPEAVLLSVEEA